MFNWLWRLFFAPKDRVPLDPDRVDNLSLKDWGMGEIPRELDEHPHAVSGDRCPKCGRKLETSGGHGPWCPSRTCKYGWEIDLDGTRIRLPGRPEHSLGGYGGPCIPGEDLPASIPRVDGPPTMGLVRSNIGPYRKGPAIPESPGANLVVTNDFAFTNLAEVRNPANTKAASITNGYNRDILLEGPMLRLFLKAGETRTIKGPIYQRAVGAEIHNPGGFEIVGVAAIDVLRDMAAERTRSMLFALNTEPRDPDQVTVGRLLEISKFTIQEL